MSLFLSWVVGSLHSTLYVLVFCSKMWALLVYSSWSMMTMAIPLSIVRTTLVLSFLSCVRALHWEGLRLQWLLCCCCSCFSILLTSDLNSSASWAGNLEDACSVAVM